MADFVLLLFIAGFVRGGWSTGFLRRLIGLGYIAISLVAGAYLRQPVGALVNQFFPKIPPSYAEMLGYSIAFGVLVAVLNLVSHQVLGKVAVQGVSRGLDKVLGAVFGGVEAVLLISAAIVILDTYFGTFGALADRARARLPQDRGPGARQLDDRAVPDPHDGAVRARDPRPAAAHRTSARWCRPGLPGLPGLPGSGAPGLPGFPFPSPTK